MEAIWDLIKKTRRTKNEMAFIKLTQNKFAEVDEEDLPKLFKHKWIYSTKNKKFQGYAQSNRSTGSIYMHRLITNCPSDKIVDHKDGNTLNNKKENLRICTQKENMRNSKTKSDNKSGYKGVHLHKLTGKWRSQITVNGKTISLGLFDDPKEAAEARKNAAKVYHGEFYK